MEEIQNRWSPRAFDRSKPVSQEDLNAVLEAASYAPSCFNEQPWAYVVGNDDADRDKIEQALFDKNREWAKNAPVLMIVLAKNTFAHNGNKNMWNQFDSGTSWGYLTLEAEKRGLQTHGMAGYDRDKARELFSIPEEYDLLAAVAMGYYGDKDQLSDELKERENPSPRKGLDEVIFNK